MNKKEYMNPVVEIVECRTGDFLMSSGVTGGNGDIGYGGRDRNGDRDPAGRMFYDDFDDFDDEEEEE